MHSLKKSNILDLGCRMLHKLIFEDWLFEMAEDILHYLKPCVDMVGMILCGYWFPVYQWLFQYLGVWFGWRLGVFWHICVRVHSWGFTISEGRRYPHYWETCVDMVDRIFWWVLVFLCISDFSNIWVFVLVVGWVFSGRSVSRFTGLRVLAALQLGTLVRRRKKEEKIGCPCFWWFRVRWHIVDVVIHCSTWCHGWRRDLPERYWWNGVSLLLALTKAIPIYYLLIKMHNTCNCPHQK